MIGDVKRDTYLGQYLGDIALNTANVKTALGWCTLATFFGENFGDSDKPFQIYATDCLLALATLGDVTK
jgi:hypothetical protein